MGDPIGPFSSPISLFTLSILLNLSGILLPCFVEDACIKFKIERIILRLNSMRRIFSGNLARKSIPGPAGDTINFVEEEEPPATDPEQPGVAPNDTEEDGDEWEDTLADLSSEKGFKFHLKKRSEYITVLLLLFYFVNTVRGSK